VPLQLVHRDVSPKNVFVTYDGAVKITDFGVAKARGRLTNTEAGGVKGKWSYMSPEQVQGEPLDRRSDVFSLGIVLWETTTGERLFEAESEMRVIMRISSGNVPLPSEAAPGYPPELERIVMRALARRPADRYPSAAAMAEELEVLVGASQGPQPGARLAELMQQLFAERIRTREAALEAIADQSVVRAETQSSPLHPPPSTGLEGSMVQEETTGGTGAATPGSLADLEDEEEVPEPDTTAAPPPAAQRPWIPRPLVLLVVALLATAAGSAIVYLAMAPAVADVRVNSVPAGATVLLDGEAVDGTTPVLLEGVRRGRHRVALRLAGHEPFEATFDVAQRDVDLDYRLVGVVAGTAAPADDSPGEVEAPPDAGSTERPSPDPEVDAGGEPAPRPTGKAVDRPARPVSPPSAGDDRSPTPAPAYLNLLADPWAQVWVNGQAAGQTPLIRREVPSGALTILLVREGRGERRTLRLHAAPGQTVSRRVAFD